MGTANKQTNKQWQQAIHKRQAHWRLSGTVQQTSCNVHVHSSSQLGASILKRCTHWIKCFRRFEGCVAVIFKSSSSRLWQQVSQRHHISQRWNWRTFIECSRSCVHWHKDNPLFCRVITLTNSALCYTRYFLTECRGTHSSRRHRMPAILAVFRISSGFCT